MKPIGIVLLVIAIILVAAMIVLYFLGKKAQKKKEEKDEQMKAAAQTVTMLIIDKKRMKMKDAGLPSQVMEQANKLIVKTDQYRAEYYKYYTGGDDWTNPTLYDLTVNTGRLSREDAARLIIQAARIKFGEDALY